MLILLPSLGVVVNIFYKNLSTTGRNVMRVGTLIRLCILYKVCALIFLSNKNMAAVTKTKNIGRTVY